MASEETSQNQFTGTGDADQINGTDQNEAVLSGTGDDTVTGAGGVDYVLGGKGEDLLIGDNLSEVQIDPTRIEIVEDYTATITFDFESAGDKHTLGVYKVDPDTGAITGVDITFENALLAGSGGDLVSGQSSVTYDVAAGDSLGFFIISNGFNQNNFDALGEGEFQFVNADGNPAGIDSEAPILQHVATDGTVSVLNGNIFHSTYTQPDHGINADGINHTQAGAENSATSFQIGFEDLMGSGDMNFEDTVFKLEVGAANGAHIIGQIDTGEGGGDDRLAALEGEDNIIGNSGDDMMHGGGDYDRINDGTVDGNDMVYGDVNDSNMLRTTEGTTFDDLAALDAWGKEVDEETGMATIVQEIETVAGEPYELTFEIAANLSAGSTSGTIEVLYNGEVIDTIDTTSGVFESHTIEFVGTGGPGSISFQNVETSDAAQDNAPDYDTSGPIVTYDSTLTVGGEEVEVSAFAPGQSNLYQVINGQFKVFDVETGEYNDVGDHFGFKVNAIGFNVEDDLVYGIAKSNGTDSLGNPVSTKDLVAVDAEGNTFVIGETPVGDFVGDFDGDGNLWTFQSSVNRITKIDVDNLDANGDPVVVNYYLPNALFGGNTYDVAYNAAGDAFYAVKAPGSNGGNGEIVKIDVSNFDGTNEPVISKVEISGTLVDGEMQTGMVKGAYGAVFMDADGNVYAGLNEGDHDLDGSTGSSGGIYKFEVDFETGQGYAVLLSDAQSTGLNDGASDPRAVDPFAPKDTTSTILIKSPEVVTGVGGNDDLRGGKGEDEIYAGAGDDTAYGNDGNDTVNAGKGDDVIDGGAGQDFLLGSDGNDYIAGGPDTDKLVGGAGSDTIEGGAGTDHFGGGNWSGDGASETFVYSHGGGKDIVHDFEARYDQIDLSAYGLTFEDIQDRLIDRGWAVEINLEGIDKSGAGDKILLKSVKAEDLDAVNFIV